MIEGIIEGYRLHNLALGSVITGIDRNSQNLIEFGIGLHNIVGSVVDYYTRFSDSGGPLLSSFGPLGPGVCFNEQQQALIQLAKEARQLRRLSVDEANTLLEWADEYGVGNSEEIEIHDDMPFNLPHIRIGPINHIIVIE